MTRSLSQNAYLWGVVYKLISDHTGIHSSRLHRYYLEQFAEKDLITFPSGDIIEIQKGSSQMTTKEMTDFIESIRQDAMEEFTTIDTETGEMKEFVIPEPGQGEITETEIYEYIESLGQ